MSTSELARALGLSPRTIQYYRQQGWITPDETSIGGHARWSIDRIRREIRDLASRKQEAQKPVDEQSNGDPEDSR